eukprot:767207-Hanusia_phi.AAC.2
MMLVSLSSGAINEIERSALMKCVLGLIAFYLVFNAFARLLAPSRTIVAGLGLVLGILILIFAHSIVSYSVMVPYVMSSACGFVEVIDELMGHKTVSLLGLLNVFQADGKRDAVIIVILFLTQQVEKIALLISQSVSSNSASSPRPSEVIVETSDLASLMPWQIVMIFCLQIGLRCIAIPLLYWLNKEVALGSSG